MRYTSVFMLCVNLLAYAFFNNVSTAQQEIDKSKRWALIIGISQYERKDDINPLRFAVNDATAIRDALIDQQTGTFLADHVLLLTDSARQKPTESNILENLAILKNQIRPEDTLLIFFSGHGYPKEREVYLLPQDARLTVLQDTAIPLTVWKERIAQIPAQTKVIILDACHSGGVEKGKGGTGEMSSQFEELIAPPVGQATLSSSKRGQASYEDEDSRHGVFTRYLLESLGGEGDANNDNNITLKEVSEYVKEGVRTWGVQKGKVQTPEFKSTLTEDVVLALAKPQVVSRKNFEIRLDTTPQGAKVFIDGRDTHETTPQIIMPQPGTHRIELRLDGYETYSGTVSISTAQPVAHVNRTLPKLDDTSDTLSEATGILYVKALMDDKGVEADVYVDGKNVGKTPCTKVDMPSRTYEIEVRGSDDYHPYTDTVVVSENETTRVEAILLPAFGSLLVTSEPPDASIEVLDMSDIRRNRGRTPLNIPRIKSGTYKLKLEKDNYYYPEIRTVTIEDGKAAEESVTFRPKFGKLVLTSEPSDAEVIFDRTPKGNTPLTLDRILSGRYTLTLRKEFYLDWSGVVEIKEGQMTERQIPLPTNFGTLKVDYEPKGTIVYLNDKQVGETPLTLKLEPNTYSLRISAGDKYQEIPSKSVVIVNKQTQELGGELQRLKGGVTILSTPGEAEIYLNSRKVGVTPKKLVNLDADDYTLTLKKNGYGDYTQTLRIRDGMLPSINVTLSQKGSVKIISTPTNADIYLDSRKIGVTPKTLSDLEPGNYTLTVKKKGYEIYTQRLRVKREMLPDINATLKKITAPEGMVLIPAGEFSMGSNDGDDHENPVHTVYLDAFYMDKHEVTVGQYKKFLQATGHKAPNWSDVSQVSPTDNHPIIYVSWNDAQAYCKWPGKRLPTEAEWEKAARGGLVGKKYPWGDSIDSSKANYNWNVDSTTPVGKYPPNGYGLYDMAGNVREWCSDLYDKNYYSSSPRNNPPGAASGSSRVVRGGSRLSTNSPLRAAYRYYYGPKHMHHGLGFRSCVAQDVTP
ncbi:PEGA domain-containing protein [bacterium]|nr:PEGA domain-containing protein [bacterium]